MAFLVYLYVTFFCLDLFSIYLEKKKRNYDFTAFLENSIFLHVGVIVSLFAAAGMLCNYPVLSFYALFSGCLLCFYFLLIDGTEYFLWQRKKK